MAGDVCTCLLPPYVANPLWFTSVWEGSPWEADLLGTPGASCTPRSSEQDPQVKHKSDYRRSQDAAPCHTDHSCAMYNLTSAGCVS